MTKFTAGNQFGVKGRPKGIKDKRHHYYDVQAKLHEMGHDPIEAIIALAKDPRADPALRFKANQELISQISPSVKAVEKRTENTLADEDIERLRRRMEQLSITYKSDF